LVAVFPYPGALLASGLVPVFPYPLDGGAVVFGLEGVREEELLPDDPPLVFPAYRSELRNSEPASNKLKTTHNLFDLMACSPPADFWIDPTGFSLFFGTKQGKL
jgi:hypothetical protein